MDTESLLAKLEFMELGHYEKKHKKHWLLSLSHGARLKRAVAVATRLPGRRLLDFGSGDGVFEKMLTEDQSWNGLIVAADADAEQIQECRDRLGHLPNTQFVTVSELSRQLPFETIVCFEVLEHIVECETVLTYLDGLLVAGGNLIISVPVETGVVLLLKQMVRFRLGGDYRYTEKYTLPEFWSAFIPTRRKHMRPVYEEIPGFPTHGHKLFNWRWLRSVLRKKFEVQDEFATPYPFLSSQRWFVCRKR